MGVKSFFEKETNTAQYVLSCPTTKESVILDPVLDYDPNTGRTETGSADTILEYVKTENLSVKFLLETHIHADHLTSSYYLKQELSKGNTSPKTCISKNITIVQKEFAKMFELDDVACDGSQFDCLLKENDELLMGDVKIKVIETPGHTPACLSYIAEIDSDKCIFVGDTLFMPDSGTARCDFPGGSADAMWISLQKILSLPPETRVFVCHDYRAGGTRDYFQWETTIREQFNNIQLQNADASSYKNFRKGRDSNLRAPKLIYPSLQFNLRAGVPPKFVKVPISAPWLHS